MGNSGKGLDIIRTYSGDTLMNGLEKQIEEVRKKA